MNENFPISRETFDKIDEESRQWLLFDSVQNLHLEQRDIKKKLARKVKIDWTIAGVMGLVGGAFAQFFGLKP